MVELHVPDRELLESVNDATLDAFPAFAPVRLCRDQFEIDDVAAATESAIDDIPAFDRLPEKAEVAITVGSRGIHDLTTMIRAIVDELDRRGLRPFIIPAMGSHGGATAEGQLETLASLGITEESMSCEVRSSMSVTNVGEDSAGDPVFASTDALEADATLLVNRVKLHTDYAGDIESGLCKMAVVGLGKRQGATSMHDAALDRGFETVIPDRAEVLFDETNIIGGIGLVENANDRAAHIEGIPVADIHEREPELLEQSAELFPDLPIDDLDLLIVDEMGKEISGTGMDTNVIGRVRFHGQHELDSPSITRIYVRSLTPPSHGNALGVGLADFVHKDVIESVNLDDMYVNIASSGETVRANLPFIVPTDATVFHLAVSTTGVPNPQDQRIVWIKNTLELDRIWVSEPVLEELDGRDNIEIGEQRPLSFDEDGTLVTNF